MKDVIHSNRLTSVAKIETYGCFERCLEKVFGYASVVGPPKFIGIACPWS